MEENSHEKQNWKPAYEQDEPWEKRHQPFVPYEGFQALIHVFGEGIGLLLKKQSLDVRFMTTNS